MNGIAYLESLKIENKFLNTIKFNFCCLDCKNKIIKEKINLNLIDNEILKNSQSYKFDIICIKNINKKNNNNKKKKWLIYHYEILEKCLKLFNKDLNKIKVFLNEFSIKEIEKKIEFFEKYNSIIFKKCDSNSTNIEAFDFDKLVNNFTEFKLKPHKKELLFSWDDFIFNNKIQKIITSSESLNSIKTQRFIDNLEGSDKENIEYEIKKIFNIYKFNAKTLNN